MLPTGDGSIGKVWKLCLTHLNSNPVASSPSLVVIQKVWPMDLNLSVVPGGKHNLANSYFLFNKKKKLINVQPINAEKYLS